MSMKFQVKNRSIECIRSNASNKQSVVARFDEQLNAAPPHVIKKLFKEELLSLAEWLTDRAVIKAAPTEQNLLCLLPSLMDQAIVALDHSHGINQESHSLLLAASEKLHEKLLSVDSMANQTLSQLSKINLTEANKERIKHVKSDLL